MRMRRLTAPTLAVELVVQLFPNRAALMSLRIPPTGR